MSVNINDLHVGCKVVIVSNVPSFNFNDRMSKYLGAVMTVREIFDSSNIKMEEDYGEHYGNGWAWDTISHIDRLFVPDLVTISNTIYDILKQWNEEKTAEIIKIKHENTEINYLDVAIDNPNRLSYITKDREERFENKFFDKEKRESFAYMGKVGKVLNKFLKNTNIKLETSDIEIIQAIMKDKLELKWEILEGEDIRKHYHYNAHCKCESIGTLEESCMRHEECQEYFDIYVKEARMLVLYCNNCKTKIIGRAILWENTINNSTGERVTWLDRIYGTNQTIELFKMYAKKKGWLFKLYQSYDEAVLTNGKDNFKLPLRIETSEYYTTYPYMDTMKYQDGLILSNEYCSNGYERVLSSTDGHYENEDY